MFSLIRRWLALPTRKPIRRTPAHSCRLLLEKLEDRLSPAVIANPDYFTVAAGQQLVVDAAHGVLVNDSTDNGSPLTAQGYGMPYGCGYMLSSDGSFNITPNLGFVGTAYFQYIACAGMEQSSPATAWITVTAPGPVANDDSFTVPASASPWATSLDVLANDTSASSFTPIIVQSPAHGSAYVANGKLWYTPNSGFSGSDWSGPAAALPQLAGRAQRERHSHRVRRAAAAVIP